MKFSFKIFLNSPFSTFLETPRKVYDRPREHRHPVRRLPLLPTRPQGLRAGAPLRRHNGSLQRLLLLGKVKPRGYVHK